MNEQLQKRKLNLKLFLSLILVALSFINTYAQQPELIWIGTLSGDESDARAVSSDGSVVVGAANDLNGNPRAFRWTAATGIQDLGTLGGDWSEATDVSADGSVIVGWSYDSNNIYRVFKWTAGSGMQDLGAGDWSKAYAVSADGSVIIVNISPIAYRWTLSGGFEDLGNLGGNSTGASDVSSDGSVITGSSNNSSGDPYAFRWVDGVGMEQIGTFYSFARGISGDGNTVTGSETGSAGLHRAFKWTQSGGFEFNIAGNFSQGNAVSGDGSIIVGDYSDGAFRLSNAGGLEALNQVYACLLTPGSDLYTAWGISSDGQYIVGYGLNGTTNQDEGYLLAVNGISSVDDQQSFPNDFVLNQNYPNPFNPSTTISFSIPTEEFVSLKVFNSLGEEVAELVNETKPAGNYSVSFYASAITSGVYFYQLSVEGPETSSGQGFIQTRKMILVK